MNALHNMYNYHDVHAIASIRRDTRIEQFKTVNQSHISTINNFNSVITILHIKESTTAKQFIGGN